jgi:hypothetical protein
MTVDQIKEISIDELKEVLLLNTAEVRYQADDLYSILDDIYVEYVIEKNSLMEKKALWRYIFITFFQVSEIIVDAIMEKLNWFEYILWCEENLAHRREIKFFVEMYYQFKADNLHVSTILNNMIDAVMTGLTEIQPDQVRLVFDELQKNLKDLPEIIKEQI